MVVTIQIKGLDRTIKNMENRERALPKATQKGMQKLAKFAVAQYKISAKSAGLNPWGGGAKSIFRDTRAVKLSKNNWGVVMPIHGIYQDRMKPHYVSFKRGRNVTKWAKQHGLKGRGMFTIPHPFMRRAEKVIFKNAGPIMRNEVSKAMKSRA